VGPLVFVLVLGIAAPPAEAKAWAERATKAFAAERYEEALAAAKKAYALDPQPELLNNLGVVLEALGRFDEAADAFIRVIADERSPEALRAKDRERLMKLKPSLESATVRFLSALDATIATARSDRGGDQRVHPGPAVLTIRSEKGVVVRNVELPVARRTTIDTATYLEREGDAFLAIGAERVRDMTVDGASLGWLPDPGTKLRLDPGRHSIQWTGREGDTHQRTIDLAPGATEPLSQPVVVEVVTAPPPSESAPVLPWVVSASGAVLVATGAVLLGVAHGTAGTLDPTPGSNLAPVTYPEAVATERRAGREAAAGVGLMIAGGVAVASGLIWGALTSAE
jgi:hypothetical protein